jgi:two-component system sensor kinase FixL
MRVHRDALARVTRLGSLSELAGAIAHEINQPLAAAGTYTRMASETLRERVPDLAFATEVCEKAAAQIGRASQVVRRLRGLVRLDSSGRSPCSAEKIVVEGIALCQHFLSQGKITVDWQAAANLPQIMVDPLLIQQTLINLIRNSVDAIREQNDRNGAIRIVIELGDDSMVQFRVTDSGPGFPPDFSDTLVPFTSQKREGMGIGLPLCRTIVEAHGGRLVLSSGKKGATVLFSVPVAKELANG